MPGQELQGRDGEHLGEVGVIEDTSLGKTVKQNLRRSVPGSAALKSEGLCLRKGIGSDFGEEARGQVLYTLSHGEKGLLAFPLRETGKDGGFYREWSSSHGDVYRAVDGGKEGGRASIT